MKNYVSCQRAYDAQEHPDYYRRTVQCGNCDGRGTVRDEEGCIENCPECKGAGEIEVEPKKRKNAE